MDTFVEINPLWAIVNTQVLYWVGMSGSDTHQSLFLKVFQKLWLAIKFGHQPCKVRSSGTSAGSFEADFWGGGVHGLAVDGELFQVSKKLLRNQAGLSHISICENEDKRKRKSGLRMNSKCYDTQSVLLRCVSLGLYPGGCLFFILCAVHIGRKGCCCTMKPLTWCFPIEFSAVWGFGGHWEKP